MSIQVRPADLKVIAKLSGQVKDITSNTKRYTWSNLHRLMAKDGWLIFYTNDGQVFLEWVIPVENQADHDFDIAIPAIQFNDLASKSLKAPPWLIDLNDGLLELSQGNRTLKIRIETMHSYPDPYSMKDTDPCWLITAALLNKNLAFVTPFIDESNAKASMKVVTWTKRGDLIGGTMQLMVRAQGLPVPLVPMNFTQRSARALGAFLAVLENDVQITVTERHYHFECPIYHHRLIIAKETASFREPDARAGGENEVLKVDGPQLRSGVSVLETLLLKDNYRLLVEIGGSQDKAQIRLSTGLEVSKSSHDEIPVVRASTSKNGSVLPDSRFVINSKSLTHALREMDGVVLTLKYYAKDKFLYIEDEPCNETDTHRVAMLTVHGMGTLLDKVPEEPKA